VSPSAGKVMAVMLWDSVGELHVLLVACETTVSAEMYYATV
jgi:hypothetical protein